MRRQIPGRSAVILATLFLGAILNACGGGGGDTAADSPPVLPASFTYQIRPLAAGPLAASNGLETLQVTDLNMNGTFNRATGELTLINGGNPGPLTTLVTGGLGTLPLEVTQELRWVGDQDPTRGEYIVRPSETEIIRVTVDNTLPGVTVELATNGQPTGSGTFTWLEFEDLYGSAAPAYQQIACFAYGARGLVFEQAGHVVEALDIITSREAELAAGPVTVNCDPYPPAGGVPGTIRYAWIDSSGNGSVGPGDSFTITFSQCWVNDATDNLDDLLDGTATLSNYTELDGPPLMIGGDMSFTDFVITETEEVSPGVFTTDPNPMTINGGFQIYFFGQ